MKLVDIRNNQHADSTDPLIRAAHEAAKATRSPKVVAALQHITEAYLVESVSRHAYEGGYGYGESDLQSRCLVELLAE